MKYFFSIILLFFISGCSYSLFETKIDTSKSATILLKTPKIKFHDSGFVNQKSNNIEIKAFATGVEVLDIDINTHICLNSVCYKKEAFNKEYLSSNYPTDTLQNIFDSSPIYNSKNINYSKDGFSQVIKEKYVDIKYEVTNSSVYFKDYQNKIIIKVTYLPTANR